LLHPRKLPTVRGLSFRADTAAGRAHLEAGFGRIGFGESGLGIALKQGKESSAIRLEGVIDIASAAELKAVLLDALKRASRSRSLWIQAPAWT